MTMETLKKSNGSPGEVAAVIWAEAEEEEEADPGSIRPFASLDLEELDQSGFCSVLLRSVMLSIYIYMIAIHCINPVVTSKSCWITSLSLYVYNIYNIDNILITCKSIHVHPHTLSQSPRP